MRHYSFYLFTALIALALWSCGSSDEGVGDGSGTGGGHHNGTISGVAQKGQFLKGSSITVYALDKSLSATGLSYPTQTTDDMGSFSVSNVNADFIDVKANGYYYNENKGKTSESTINLQAVAASSSKVNVNLLTTLAYNRIKHLVGTGLKFSDAQSRAQIEVLTALGLGNLTSANFTDMNIAGSGDANGLLLAASLLIQQNRSVGDVSKLISDIAADLEEDGVLSSDLNQEIHRYERYIYVGDVIQGLISFYEKNKVTDFSIPTFYKFLDTDGDGKMDGMEGYIFENLEAAIVYPVSMYDINPGYSANGFSFTERYLSTVPFKAESDVAWITVETKTIAENFYSVNIVAKPNTGQNRTGHVTFTDNAGKELAKHTYQQKAPEELVPQRLVFSGVGHFMTDKIGVNGITYNVAKNPSDIYIVDIPYGDKQDKYQLYFPVNMVSMPNGYGSYKLTIPENITSDEIPFISQREEYEGIQISNPAQVIFKTACPSIVIRGFESVDHIVLSSDKPICGSAIYNINEGSVDILNPQIIEQETHADSDGIYRFTVKMIHHDDVYETIIPILQFKAPVHVQCYSATGQLIREYDETSIVYYPSYNSGGGTTR